MPQNKPKCFFGQNLEKVLKGKRIHLFGGVSGLPMCRILVKGGPMRHPHPSSRHIKPRVGFGSARAPFPFWPRASLCQRTPPSLLSSQRALLACLPMANRRTTRPPPPRRPRLQMSRPPGTHHKRLRQEMCQARCEVGT